MLKRGRVKSDKIVIMDGATGTNLLNAGLKPGEAPCVLNLRNPAAVLALHRAYLDAGSDLILTNTLNANPDQFDLRTLNRIIHAGVALARRAAGIRRVLGDVGPMGALLEPYGKRTFDSCRKAYATVFRSLHRYGASDYFLETFTSIREAKAAFLAARPYGRRIYVSFSLDSGGRTLLGEIPESFAVTFDRLGAAGIGVNCLDPRVARDAVARMARVTKLPISVKPNAGRVIVRDRLVRTSLDAEAWVKFFPEYIDSGAVMLGGCCGTTPDFIRRLARCKRRRPRPRAAAIPFMVCGSRRTYEPTGQSVGIVGERLNPSGRKKLRESISRGDFSIYATDAASQFGKGADLLDVNAYSPDTPEPTTLNRAVDQVIHATGGPLFIDTLDYGAAEKVLAAYPGIGVYNSVPARPRELRRFLPMIKRYGFKAVISLVGTSVPRTASQRLANFRQALRVARAVGFPSEDLIFDPLVLPAASGSDQMAETLKAAACLTRCGRLTVLGVSNVSYGMEERSGLNAAFAVLAVQAGVRFLIVNPLDDNVTRMIRDAVRLFRPGAIPSFPGRRPLRTASPAVDLGRAIIDGDPAAARGLAQALLNRGVDHSLVLDRHIIPALHEVGDLYHRGRYFLPDLLRSAEASQAALAVVRKHQPSAAAGQRIVLATVKGDIHDIGKNIAALVFSSAGYRVIDLGKDVSAQRICAAVRKYRPFALGLSALLTTTMPEMGRVIALLRQRDLNTPVIVGGPNVSPAFAREIGACAAVHSALDGLKALEKLNKK